MATFETLRKQAAREPIGVDISDYSDEWCEGFLAGQVSVLEEVERDDLLGLAKFMDVMEAANGHAHNDLFMADGCPLCAALEACSATPTVDNDFMNSPREMPTQ